MEGAQLLGGRYALLDQLGSGGMAVVWRARDEVLGRTVAVKVLAGRHAGEPDARDRIRAEARAAAALSHPNIAQVYDYGEAREGAASIPYVVMELVRGTTLQHRLDAAPISPRFAMRMAAEVAAALAAAHSDGLVHRDIKPANVMVTETGAKVVDFGIAAAINPAGTGDEEFEVLGTPAYLAPERLTGDGVEPASDVYALGVLLYRMLSGQSPWSADTTTQMLSAHIYIDPEPLPVRPGVPDYVTALCNRCLSKDPTQRPSAREAAALLAQGAGLRVVEDALPAGPAGPSHDGEPSVLIRPRAVPKLRPPSWYDDPVPAAPVALPPAVFDPAPGPAAAGNRAAPDPGETAVSGFASGAAAGLSGSADPAGGPSSPPGGDRGPASGADGGSASGGVRASAPGGDRGSAAGADGVRASTPGGVRGSAFDADGSSASGSDRASAVGGAASGPAAAAGTDPAARRRRRAVPVAAVVLLLALGGLLWWLIGSGDRDDAGQVAVAPGLSGAPGSVAPSVNASPTGGRSSAPARAQNPGATDVTDPAAAPGDRPPAAGAPGVTATTTPPPPDVDEPAPTTTAPTTAPPAQERTFTSTGGSVRATCPGSSTAELLSWSPTKPYKVEDVEEGPASSAAVVFKHGNRLVRMTVTCSGGVPSSATES